MKSLYSMKSNQYKQASYHSHKSSYNLSITRVYPAIIADEHITAACDDRNTYFRVTGRLELTGDAVTVQYAQQPVTAGIITVTIQVIISQSLELILPLLLMRQRHVCNCCITGDRRKHMPVTVIMPSVSLDTT